jgi:hypothetical protein
MIMIMFIVIVFLVYVLALGHPTHQYNPIIPINLIQSFSNFPPKVEYWCPIHFRKGFLFVQVKLLNVIIVAGF